MIVIYIAVHELIHGFLMKIYSEVNPEYGFSGPFIFAKSEAVFDKRPYLIITSAPMVILGFLSLICFYLLPGIGIWLAAFIWSLNLYASRGDIQAILTLRDLPTNYGIKDEGDSLIIYQRI